MTGKEMEKAIAKLIAQQKAMIEQQTKIDNRLEFLAEQQANIEQQAEKDRQAMRDLGRHMSESIDRLEAQADADRAEIRDAIGKLLGIVENTRDFSQQLAKQLAQAQ